MNSPLLTRFRLLHATCALVAAVCSVAGICFAEDKPAAGEKEFKVMLMIDERNLGTIPTSEIESLAAKAFFAQGVQVVDQEMVRANIKKDQQLLKMAGDNRGAASVGLQFNADLIIVGDAVAKPSASRIADTQLRTYQASVTLRAVRTDNSETIASVSEIGTALAIDDVMGGSKSLNAAGKKAVDAIVAAVVNKMGVGDPDDNSKRKIVLTFGGVDQSWKVKAIRKLLEKRDDLGKVSQQSYDSGYVLFSVESRIPARKLSEELTLNPPSGLKFQVLEVVRGKISMRAVAEK